MILVDDLRLQAQRERAGVQIEIDVPHAVGVVDDRVEPGGGGIIQIEPRVLQIAVGGIGIRDRRRSCRTAVNPKLLRTAASPTSTLEIAPTSPPSAPSTVAQLQVSASRFQRRQAQVSAAALVVAEVSVAVDVECERRRSVPTCLSTRSSSWTTCRAL